jgi:hypothetical protein
MGRGDLARPEYVPERLGLLDDRPECVDPSRLDEIIRVLARREEGKFDAETGLQDGQKPIDRAKRGRLAGRVAIKADDRLGGETPPEDRDLFLGQRGAERRNDRLEACLDDGDRVEVAFDDDDGVGLEGVRPGAMAVEDDLALPEQDRLGLLRYLGATSGESARPPKATTRPFRSWIGMINRPRNRS